MATRRFNESVVESVVKHEAAIQRSSRFGDVKVKFFAGASFARLVHRLVIRHSIGASFHH